MKKYMLVLLLLFIGQTFFATELDSLGFDITFMKKGENRIGFYDPALVSEGAGLDSYISSRPSSVVFKLGSGSDTAMVSSEANVGIYWQLFPEGLDAENYTVDVIFSSDTAESVDSSMTTGMLKDINGNLLNYDVYVGAEEQPILNPGSFALISGESYIPYSETASPGEARHIRFTENSVGNNGKFSAYELKLSLSDVPYGNDTGTGVSLETYSGYIIMRLERV